MNREDIIQMAREAGASTDGPKLWLMYIEDIERFAQLVAAAERDQMIQDGWRQCAKGQKTTQFCGQLLQAVEAEREACAKLCDEIGDESDSFTKDILRSTAEVIRARGQQ